MAFTSRPSNLSKRLLFLFTLGVAAGVAIVTSLIPALLPVEPSNPKIVGQWASDYSYPITDGTMRIEGLANYFRKGKYSVSGTITMEGQVDRKPFKFIYIANGAGTWSADSERLHLSLTDLKTIPKTLSFNDFEVPPQLVAMLTGQRLSTVDDACPAGISNELTLRSVDQNTIVLGATAPSGKPFTIEMHRRPLF